MRPLLLVLAMAVTSRAARLYYVNQPELQPGQVNAVNPDGTGFTSLYTAGEITDIRGLALDAANQRLFLAHAKQNASTLALTGVSLAVLPVTGGTPSPVVGFPDNTFLGDVEWDAASNRVYLAQPVNLRLLRCRPDGSALETILTHTAAGQGPYFAGLDPATGRAYWSLLTNPGDTFTAYSRGSLTSGTTDAAWSLVTPSRTRDIAIDNRPPGGRLYWCDRQNGAVYARAPEGGPVQTVITGLNAPHGLALDSEAGYAYAADTGKRGSGSQASAHDLVRFKMDGTGGLEILSPFNAAAEPYDVDIDTRTVSYADWRRRYFTATAANAGTAGDPDGDGLNNAAEYAFFTHPLRRDTPQDWISAVPGGVRYPRRLVSDALTTVEVSADLTTWHWNGETPGSVWTVEQDTSPRDADSQWVTAAAGPAAAGNSRTYFRIRVSLP